jgi:hypothetical protein
MHTPIKYAYYPSAHLLFNNDSPQSYFIAHTYVPLVYKVESHCSYDIVKCWEKWVGNYSTHIELKNVISTRPAS